MVRREQATIPVTSTHCGLKIHDLNIYKRYYKLAKYDAHFSNLFTICRSNICPLLPVLSFLYLVRITVEIKFFKQYYRSQRTSFLEPFVVLCTVARICRANIDRKSHGSAENFSFFPTNSIVSQFTAALHHSFLVFLPHANPFPQHNVRLQ